MPSRNEVYQCKHCGNIVEVLHGGKAPLICCGEPMKLLREGETDGAMEKHVPVIEKKCGEIKVSVGSVMHPATEEHYIEWVLLVSDNGYQLKYVPVGQEAVVSFRLGKGEKLEAVYAYCNLHGLWKAD